MGSGGVTGDGWDSGGEVVDVGPRHARGGRASPRPCETVGAVIMASYRPAQRPKPARLANVKRSCATGKSGAAKTHERPRSTGHQVA